MKKSGLITFAFLLLCAACSCSRPQVASTQQAGETPKVVQIVADSEQEKGLRAAAGKWHEDWVQPVDNPVQSAPKTPAIEPAPMNGSATPAAPATPAASPPDTPTAPAAPATPAGGPPESTPPTVGGTSPPPATVPPVAAPMTPAAAPMTPAADPGSEPATPPGKKKVTASSQAGRKSKEFGSGLIATPIGAYFGTRERIAIMNMEEQLKLWSTQNERPPRDMKEFIEVIIKPAQIKLPALRKGERYVFDPKQGPHGTLLIEQPAEPEK